MNKIHCKGCAKMRRPNLFIESVINKEGKVERLHMDLKKILKMIKEEKGMIKLFQRGTFANLCTHCGSISTYTVNDAGKIVVI